MYYCMEVDKVAFGTQGHKRSLIGNGILLLLCAPSPHYIATDYSGAPRRACRTNCMPSKLNCSSRLYNNKLSSIAVVMPGSVEPKSKAAAAAITRKKTDVTALLLL